MMGRWQSRFVLLAVSVIAAHATGKVESHFLSSAKNADTTLQDIRGRALPAVSKEEGLPELEKQEGGSRKVYTTKRLLEEKEEGEEKSKPSVHEESTEVNKDGEKSDKTKELVESNAEGEMGKDEADKEEEAAKAESVGQAVTDLLLWYLSPYVLSRPEQAVSSPQPVLPPLAHDGVTTPSVGPNFHNFSTLPSNPFFVVAPTLPKVPRSPQSTPPPAKENKTQDSSMHTFRTREDKGSRPTPETFPTFPLTVWLELIANALSDEVYQIHIQRQMSPPARSSDFSARVPLEDEAKFGSDRIEEVKSAVDGIAERQSDSEVKEEFEEDPLKAPLLLNPLPAFKMNKSMRPYVSSPIPLSPFYTFDKPPHFFPSFSFPLQKSAEPQETKTTIAETTLPAEEPTADSAGVGNL